MIKMGGAPPSCISEKAYIFVLVRIRQITAVKMASGAVELAENDLDGEVKFSVIRDLYNSEDYAVGLLEEQLESSLESRVSYIIIEPKQIGDETSKWIKFGNSLHKTAVLTGIACLVVPAITPIRWKTYLVTPLFTINTLCTVLYDLSWQFDPCCKYQVEQNESRLEQLHLQTLATTSPVVLVYRDDKYRKRLHNTISFLVITYVGWKFFQYYRG